MGNPLEPDDAERRAALAGSMRSDVRLVKPVDPCDVKWQEQHQPRVTTTWARKRENAEASTQRVPGRRSPGPYERRQAVRSLSGIGESLFSGHSANHLEAQLCVLIPQCLGL